MPPRHTYWTIILEGKPTAFRAHTREELAPTLRQLQARHPDAVLVWFARGRLWESPAQEAAARRSLPRERRGPGWRPGGTHQDPRERFRVPRDDKRRRFAARMRRDPLGPRERDRPEGDAPRGPERDPRERHRPRGPKWERPWERGRPRDARTDRPRQDDRREGTRRPRDERDRSGRQNSRSGRGGDRRPARGGGRRGGGGGGRSR